MQNIKDKDLTHVLGFAGLSDEEKLVVLSELGGAVMDKALVRLVTDLTEEQTVALEQFLETEPSAEVMYKHLLDHHKDFEKIVEDELLKLRSTLELADNKEE